VNARLETTAPGIWALGDVTGGPPFTHASYDDFRILRANLLHGGTRTTEGRMVPYCVFTDPELGRVGMSETEARKSGRDVLVATTPMNRVARATEMAESRGMMKAVVEKDSRKLLGAAVLGFGGGEVITELQLAMLGGLTADTIAKAIFIHPVLAEGLHPLFHELH
jgi:pyruvate/2-oxoglutarate dehydrogenase complex dihydrolipoamide dehydrogenase (E3) component